MVWRKTEIEYVTATIIRALRRDIPNVGVWSNSLKRLIDEIETGEILIVRQLKDDGKNDKE